jgi:hypothetical protein
MYVFKYSRLADRSDLSIYVYTYMYISKHIIYIYIYRAIQEQIHLEDDHNKAGY